MRIKEEFKKSGYFWLPATPEHKIPGTLHVTNGGEIEIEVVGVLECKGDLIQAFNADIQPGIINGDIEDFGYITLKNCIYKNRNIQLTGQISKSKIYVGMAILGVAFSDDEKILINTLQFSIDGLNDWVGISGFKFSPDFEAKAFAVEYKLPEEISYKIDEKIKLRIGFSAKAPAMKIGRVATLEQQTYLELCSEEPVSLDEFLNLAFKITNFVGFGVNASVGLDSVTATSKAFERDWGSGKKTPIPMKVIYASLPFSKEPPEIEVFRMLFGFGMVRSRFETILKNWLGAYERIDPSLNLYFSVANGSHQYLENKFLALAQCLETYHRRTSDEKLMNDAKFKQLVEAVTKNCPEEYLEWLTGRIQHGNELSLSQRIKKIIEPFKNIVGSGSERNKLIRAIVNTRNYLTHYNEALEADAAKGKDLWLICKKMEAIFQLHLLDVLSFSKEEIVAVYENSSDLKQKLKPV